MSEIRIKDLPETLDVDIGDYVAVDNEGDGVRRYNLKHLVSSTSAPEFVIHVDSSLVSDKTFLEASEAIANGYVPVVIYDTRYYTLTKVTDSKMTFSVVDSYTPATIMEVVLHNGSGTTVETTTITSSSINNWSNVPGDKITDALNDLSSNVTYITNDMTTAKGDIESLDSRVTALENEGGSSGGGLTQTEKNLILTLFNKATEESDADIAYDQLEALWGTSEKTITYNLTNCISTNSATSVESNETYSTSLAVQSGYTITTATVTMGGADVTASCYNSGQIIIQRVTGDVVITAVAVSETPEEGVRYKLIGTDCTTATSQIVGGANITFKNAPTLETDGVLIAKNNHMLIENADNWFDGDWTMEIVFEPRLDSDTLGATSDSILLDAKYGNLADGTSSTVGQVIKVFNPRDNGVIAYTGTNSNVDIRPYNNTECTVKVQYSATNGGALYFNGVQEILFSKNTSIPSNKNIYFNAFNKSTSTFAHVLKSFEIKEGLV